MPINLWKNEVGWQLSFNQATDVLALSCAQYFLIFLNVLDLFPVKYFVLAFLGSIRPFLLQYVDLTMTDFLSSSRSLLTSRPYLTVFFLTTMEKHQSVKMFFFEETRPTSSMRPSLFAKKNTVRTGSRQL